MQPWNWQNPIGAKPISRAELDAMTKPQGQNQNEVCTHVLWDIQSIANGAAGPFTFFGLQNDPTLGNMPLANQLADPMFFIPQWMYVDYLVLPTAGTAALFAPISDIAELQVNQRAIFQINNGPKSYPVGRAGYPLRIAGPIGGLIPYATLEGATAAPGAGLMYANGGIPGSQGFYVGGSWAIGPSTKFSVSVTVAGAPTLSVTTRVMVSFTGTLYQAVA